VPELVSVLIPLFGRHRGEQVLDTVCAGWARQGAPCEVVVAVAGDAAVPTHGHFRLVEVDPALSAPGVLRNHAAGQAAGDWLYLSDADVRPVGADYLARALRLADNGALAQPWMFRRISAAPFRVGSDDLGWDGELQRLSVTPCCFIQDPVEGTAPQPCTDERYVWEDETLMVIPPAGIPLASGELRWRPPFHWGGMLVRRDVFDAVGGYHTGYVGWGCEDDDLLAKIGARVSVTVAWRADPTLRCVHYEHARPYDDPGFAANQARLVQRLASGPEAMIQADVDVGRAVPNEERPTCAST
jgi:hypothetical protein